MRSLKYLAAALPIFGAAYAGAGFGGDDETVIVTTTRFVTVCPVEFWTTCDANDDHSTPTTRSGGPSSTTTTTETTGTSITSKITETSQVTSTIVTTYTGPGGKNGTVSTITTAFNQTNTITTALPNPNNTSIIGGGNLTSTTTGCYNASRTAAPFDQNYPGFGGGFGGKGGFQCNQPGDRSSWCNGKTIDSDPEALDYTTGHTRTYNLVIEDAMIDADGTGAIAGFTVNGKTPGDAIVANWGDTVQVTVTNNMAGNSTTIHWHGILQHGTNDQDGVPGVTECGIAPGQSKTYTWVASTYGTGWYHSHLLSQYGGGIRGPIVIHGPATSDYDLDLGTVMVNEKFDATIFNLAKSYTTARGTVVPSNYLLNGMNTNKNATTGTSARWIVKSGKKHLFRFINSSAQTAFAMHFDNHVMTVVSADMVPIVPYQTETLYIQGGQRYNVIVEANQPSASYYLRAIAQKGCGASINNDGNGIANGIITYEDSCFDIPAVSNFTLNLATTCLDEPLASLVPHIAKDGGSVGAFTNGVQVLPGGNVDAVPYADAGAAPVNTWRFGGPQALNGTASGKGLASINVNYTQPTLQLLGTVGQPSSALYSNAVVLNQTADTWVYWIIQNQFITAHPMHLHGHDFAVLGQKEGAFFSTADIPTLNFVNPMRRDTVLLFGSGSPQNPVPGWTVIGFQTNNPGAWVMHCHVIWHADGGMGMQFIERPSEITNYAAKSDFQSECAAVNSYQTKNPGGIKASYESGLKIRHLEEHKFHGKHALRHE